MIILVALTLVATASIAGGFYAWRVTPYEVPAAPSNSWELAKALDLNLADVQRELEALDCEFPAALATMSEAAAAACVRKALARAIIPPAELESWRQTIDPRTQRITLSSGRVISRERLEDAISGRKPMYVD